MDNSIVHQRLSIISSFKRHMGSSGEGLMRLAESSGALDFLLDEREDIYSVDDLKVRYQ